ncbi:MAG: ABC transporter permease subunit [Actinobacteria bacterium]|nr:ABC transporter permease subunit [Actinomycetota bacterium]
MRANIARLDLRLRRRSLTWYAVGMVLYTLLVVVLYPSFKHQTTLNSLSGSTAAALLGITGKLTSPDGWLNANIYGNFFPLIMLLLTIGYGAAALAGQDEDGTLTLVAALPIRRSAILLQKAGAMALQALLLGVAVAICVVVGRGFQLSTSPADTAAVTVALVLMGLDFGLITMAAGVVTGRRGAALGVGAGLAAASYVLSSLASTISSIRPGRYFSLFYWSVGNNQLSRGVSAMDFAALLGVGLIVLVAAVAVFRRADLN